MTIENELNRSPGGFPYYIEVWDRETRKWRAELRYYLNMQDEDKFLDDGTIRNFKFLGTERQPLKEKE